VDRRGRSPARVAAATARRGKRRLRRRRQPDPIPPPTQGRPAGVARPRRRVPALRSLDRQARPARPGLRPSLGPPPSRHRRRLPGPTCFPPRSSPRCAGWSGWRERHRCGRATACTGPTSTRTGTGSPASEQPAVKGASTWRTTKLSWPRPDVVRGRSLGGLSTLLSGVEATFGVGTTYGGGQAAENSASRTCPSPNGVSGKAAAALLAGALLRCLGRLRAAVGRPRRPGVVLARAARCGAPLPVLLAVGRRPQPRRAAWEGLRFIAGHPVVGPVTLAFLPVGPPGADDVALPFLATDPRGGPIPQGWA